MRDDDEWAATQVPQAKLQLETTIHLTTLLAGRQIRVGVVHEPVEHRLSQSQSVRKTDQPGSPVRHRCTSGGIARLGEATVLRDWGMFHRCVDDVRVPHECDIGVRYDWTSKPGSLGR